ncbi:hypothetical protein ABDK56_11070 [Sphingomonas sp. ASV193]|uniref:hypothetical protein n=1 Tax=Sphingomonas sp. ASV193 TaxID=3144405 RepID=UPI0032E8ADF4
MHVGDYLLGLVTIVLGLALAAMATAIDRLVKRRREVRLDAVTILAAAFVFYAVIANLWAEYVHYHTVTAAPLAEGATMIVTFMITYLMAALVLPDEWEGKLDLRDHYKNVRRPLWGLFGLNALAVFTTNIVRNGAPKLSNYVSLAIGLAISFILMNVRPRIVQMAVLLGVLALQVWSLGNLEISG